ncbi:MAG: 50S ribosomal protein L25 [Planctomycetes bacterium ADurb.Bin401]|nr:MAG: 50S ribosomal protein L25 [Planctomycetes bacterium ADurb.Bin401]
MVSKEGLVLKAQTRSERGKKHNAKLREKGNIPGIIYGHKQEPQAIVLNEHDFVEVLHHGKKLMDIEVDGKSEKLLLKELQYDHLGKKIVHTDFLRVNLSEKVTVTVPLVFKGTAVGVAEGGIMEEHLDSIEVECTVTEIPESIDVSIKGLKIGDFMEVKDIVLPQNIKLVTSPELLVVACKEPVEIVEATPEEAALEPTAPEVITERKPKEEEGEEAGKEKK